jgi:hypothetical protein
MNTQTETFDRRFPVSEPAELVLTDISGTVTIAAWDLPDIHVAGVKRAGGFLPWITPEEGFRATRIEMEQQSSRVVVRTSRTQEGFWGFLNWLGGAAILSGVVVLAVGARQSAQERRMSVTPTLSRQGGGASLTVRW